MARLKGYDYSTPGMYFVTICTKNRKEVLSKITVGTGLPDCPQNILTQHGEIANCYLTNMMNFYNNIAVDKYVIMPNHIHVILHVFEYESGNGQSGRPVPTNGTPDISNSIVSKFVGTFKRLCNKEYGENIWQSRFHDHIIRGKEDYEKIWEYIDTNVLNWELDCFYNG